MMEESRKQFEEEYNKLMGTPLSVIKNLREGENYRYTEGDRLQIAWKMWQASRAAMEIELPIPAYSRMDIQAATIHRVNLCKKAIRAAGLKIKGE